MNYDVSFIYFTDEVTELLCLQRLEDERNRASCSEFINHNVKAAKKGCVVLELDLKTWNDVVKVLQETQSNEIRTRLQNWLIHEGIIQNEEINSFTVETDTVYDVEKLSTSK